MKTNSLLATLALRLSLSLGLLGAAPGALWAQTAPVPVSAPASAPVSASAPASAPAQTAQEIPREPVPVLDSALSKKEQTPAGDTAAAPAAAGPASTASPAGTAAVAAPAAAASSTTPAPDAAAAAAPAAAPTPHVDSGDTAWMLTSTLLVILMMVPGLALFYGGLARSKNMLSLLMQVFVIFCLISLLWAVYGYSLAFSGEGRFFGGLDKLFLRGVTQTSFGALNTIPEYVFLAFQGTFAAITVAITVGAFAERARFAAVLVFAVLWFTLSYVPIAHIVWGGGLLAADGALDFAGGTVVHINAGVAGLVGAWMVGRRLGYGREPFTPHSLTLTMVGASLLWVGWFGFNAGSAGAANAQAGLAFVNTVLATAAAALAWLGAEALHRGRASMLGAASGAVAGLVAVTPAAGFVGPMGAIAMGALAGPVCLWGVGGCKRLLRADDAFDAFGIHGLGGIVGALLTGIFAAPSLGGTGGPTPDTFAMGAQLWVQTKSVLLTVVWAGVTAFIAFKVADLLVGLRVPEEAEREGLDITSHGETAYTR